MAATTALVFLSLSDHRAATNADRVDVPPSSATAVIGAAAAPATAPVVASIVAEQASGARPRDRLVVAAMQPERSLVRALMPGGGGPGGSPASPAALVVAELNTEKDPTVATDAQSHVLRDWEGDAFVGPLPPSVEAVPAADIELEDAIESAVADASPAATEPSAAADSAAPIVTAGPKADAHRHPLGFDPLREPALTGAAAKEGAAAKKGLAELFTADEEHTVRYVREITHEVRSGETLSTVLSRHGVGSADVARWVAAVRRQYNPNRIYAGQSISLSIDMPEKRLRRVKFDLGRDGSLVIEDGGTTMVAKQKAPAAAAHESNIRVVEGEITSSLYAVASAKGVPD